MDEREGYGVLKWTDGSVYLGMWKGGIQSGVGVMIFPDGSTRAGIFENNVFKSVLKSIDEIEDVKD